MASKNPFLLLGINAEVIKNLNRNEVKDLVVKTNRALLAAFHPDTKETTAEQEKFRKKYHVIVNAFEEIDPKNIDSNFDSWLDRLRSPSKEKKSVVEMSDRVVPSLLFKNEILATNLSNLVNQISSLKLYGEPDEKNVHRTVSALSLPEGLYFTMKSFPGTDLHTSIGIHIENGLLIAYKEKLITKDKVDSCITEGHKVTMKGDKPFLLEPYSVDLSSWVIVGVSKNNIADTRDVPASHQHSSGYLNGKISSTNGDYLSHDDLFKKFQQGSGFSTMIGVDGFLIVAKDSEKGIRYDCLGKISRMSLARDHAPQRGNLLSSGKKPSQKKRSLSDGYYSVEVAGEVFKAATALQFAEDYGCDVRHLRVMIKRLHISSLPMAQDVCDNKGRPIPLYRLEDLQRVAQCVLRNDGTTMCLFGTQNIHAMTTSSFFNKCKERDPPMHPIDFYRIIGEKILNSVGSAYVPSDAIATVELFAVQDLEKVYSKFVRMRVDE